MVQIHPRMLVFIDGLVGRPECDELARLGRVQKVAKSLDAAPVTGTVFGADVRRLQPATCEPMKSPMIHGRRRGFAYDPVLR